MYSNEVIEKSLREYSIKEKVNIKVANAVWTKEKVWFTAYNFNGLFYKDLISGKIELVGRFPNEKYSQACLFWSMRKIENKLFFIPLHAKNIAVYDIDKNKFESIEIDRNKIQGKLERGFYSGVQRYNNFLFLIPAFSNAIIRLNVENYEMLYLSEWSKEIEKDIFDEYDLYFFGQSVIKENILYIPFCNANAMLELNCDILQYKIYKLGNEKRGYAGICSNKENLWMVTRKSGKVINLNIQTRESAVYSLYSKDEKEEGYNYLGISCNKNIIEVYPTREIRHQINKENLDINIKKGRYSFVDEVDDIILFYEISSGLLFVIDKKSNKKWEEEISIENKIIDIEKILEERKFMEEVNEINLRNILSYMEQDLNHKNVERKKTNLEGSIYLIV